MGGLRLGLFWRCAFGLALGGCSEESLPTGELQPAVETPSPEVVYAPRAEVAEDQMPPTIQPAFVDDLEYVEEGTVEARRVVYRVSLRVPRNLGNGHAGVAMPAAELDIDVSWDRLRARFVGTGWPVPAGSEVRIRRDQPGAYVFDDQGGRPLGPGQLAQWFEGGRLRRSASLRISSPADEEQVGPGNLVCRFIAEWSHTPPDALVRRCGEGGTPPSFRVGLWRARRTADVGVLLPKRALRADHGAAPELPARESGRAFLSPTMFARLRRLRGHRAEEQEGAPVAGMEVENRSPARIVVTVGGTPIGFVDSGERLLFPHLRPGAYAVGAMRPFGLQVAQKRARSVPSRVRLPR